MKLFELCVRIRLKNELTESISKSALGWRTRLFLKGIMFIHVYLII